MERGVKEFEEVQMGLERRQRQQHQSQGVKRKAGDRGEITTMPHRQRIIGRENGKVIVEEDGDEEGGDRDSKRAKTTFTLDESELLRIARSDRERLKDSIVTEKSVAAAPKLPSFWIPSLTPSLSTAELAPIKAPKLQPVCPASNPDKLHHYSLKGLVNVKFEEEGGEKNKHGEPARICPSCRKGLSNETKAVGKSIPLAFFTFQTKNPNTDIVAKPCGHVICRPCVKKFILKSDDPHSHFGGKEQRIQCSVCEEDLSPEPGKKSKDKDKDAIKPGLVQISSDGTGFIAGGGQVLAKKEMVAFQC